MSDILKLNKIDDEVITYKGKPVIIIDANDQNFDIVLICAIRYALGRMTYVPDMVTKFIESIFPMINDKTLYRIIKDIEEYDEDVSKGIYSWGMDFDEKMWRNFLRKCKIEYASKHPKSIKEN